MGGSWDSGGPFCEWSCSPQTVSLEVAVDSIWTPGVDSKFLYWCVTAHVCLRAVCWQQGFSLTGLPGGPVGSCCLCPQCWGYK